MEAFLRNVPPDLTDDSLRKELEPFMKALGIADWACDKPRRKSQAWVSFLHLADGEKFLKRHGKVIEAVPVRQGKKTAKGSNVEGSKGSDVKVPKSSNVEGVTPGMKAPKGNNNLKTNTKTDDAISAANPAVEMRIRNVPRLHITKKPIYAERSYRSINKLTLSHLQHEQNQRAHNPRPSPGTGTGTGTGGAVAFELRQIACGHNVFTNPTSNVLTFAQQCAHRVSATARLTQQSLSIVVSGLFRIDVPCEAIVDFIAGHNDHSLTLVLSEPPRFYAAVGPQPSTSPATKWERRGSCPHWPDHAKYAGRCLAYQLSTSGPDFGATVRAIKNRDLISVTQDTLPVNTTPEPFVHDHSTSMAEFDGCITRTSGTNRLPFPLLFQVQALVWNNYLHPSEGAAMLDRMERLAADTHSQRRPLPLTVESLKKLFYEIPYRCPGTEPREVDVRELVNRAVRIETDLRRDDPLRDEVYGQRISEHQAWAMKAMVTPSRIVLHGPEPESKNRILRRFARRTDFFLRCLFCDDDGQDLAFHPSVSNDAVYERYRRVLREGVQVAGRRFSFLGFSHSSLRSHAAWFMAPFTDENWELQSCDSIVRSLGRFDDIRVPAKCAARIGQAFSETPYAVPVFERGIDSRQVPDVKNADGSRVFSDGVGTVSPAAVREFRSFLPDRAGAATCFQIRWGGAKGMLSLDSRLRGNVFCIRNESMRKFPSTDLAELGICDTASRPLRLVLNRQLIKIMEDMGTSDAWFMALQARELRVLRAVTAQASNTSTFLRHQLIGTPMGFPALIRHMGRLDIEYRRDDFLRTVVEHAVLRELRLLKHKARIPVPGGVTLFGIMDETGVLEEDQVYITFDKSTSPPIDAPPPHNTPAVITRSPALHPGDVRVVTLVQPPPDSPLRHLRNCVVFSQRGTRDLPSQLSGGDLDGDLYSVIWDPAALPLRVFHPADYPRVDPEPLDRAVTREDIADFFINFMRTDVLGMIATRHQIMADVMDEGTRAPDCIALAELHSTAVDSSKTGIPVNVRDLPRAPRTRPDFLAPAPPLKTYDMGQIAHIGADDAPDSGDEMGAARHRYHRSDKVLGRLYRNIDEKRIWAEDISRTISSQRGDPSVWDQLLNTVEQQLSSLGRYSRTWQHMDEAWRIRNLYDSAVADMRWQFADNPRTPISEVEVFTGSVLNKRGSQTRRQRDASVKLRDEMDRVSAWIVDVIRDNGGRKTDEVLDVCLACVHVGCVRDPAAVGVTAYHGTGELQSFKVLAASCLLRELNSLSKAADVDGGGGGFVGVSGGRREMTLALRERVGPRFIDP